MKRCFLLSSGGHKQGYVFFKGPEFSIIIDLEKKEHILNDWKQTASKAAWNKVKNGVGNVDNRQWI